MRRPLLAAVIAIQALAICRVEGAAMDRLSLLAPQPLGITAPTEGELAFLADHAIAMTQYRWMAEQGLSERGYRLRRRGQAFDMPWLWAAEDGGTIHRRAEGVFRLMLAAPRRDWFFEVNCHRLGWPFFACDDGMERRMEAPDLETLIFGDIHYSRIMPSSMVDLSPPDGLSVQERDTELE